MASLTKRNRVFTCLLIGLQVLLVVAAVSGTLAYLLRLRTEILAEHARAAEAQAKALEDHLTQSLTLASLTLATLPVLAPSGPTERNDYPELDRVLDETLHRLPLLRSLSLATADGFIVASSTPNNEGRQLRVSDFPLRAGDDGALHIGTLWQGRDLGEGHPVDPLHPIPPNGLSFLPLLRRLETEAGTWLTIASINPGFFLNQIEHYAIAGVTSVDVLNYDGILLWSSHEAQPLGTQVLSGQWLDEMKEREIGTLPPSEANGRDLFTAYRASSIYPLFVVVNVDRQAALAHWRDETRHTLFGMALALIALLTVTTLLSLRVFAAQRKEERMQEERRLAASVFEHSTDGILVTDAQRRIIAVNPALEHGFGYSAAELLGETPCKLAADDLSHSLAHAIDGSRVATDGLWRGEIASRRRDGSLLHEWLTVSRVQDAQGAALHYVAVFQDLTEQYRQARRLERQLAALRSLNDIVAVTGLDPLATLRQALRVAVEHLGLEFGVVSRIDRTRDEYRIIVQHSPPGTLQDDQLFRLTDTYCNATLTQNDVLAIDASRDEAFRESPCLMGLGLQSYIGAPVRVNDRVIGTLGFSSTRSRATVPEASDLEFVRMLARWAGAFLERMAADEELRTAKNAAEAASLAKSQFLATMSHELRTPLNGILGMAQLLMGRQISESEQRDFARTIYQSGETLLALLNDILDLAKVESGKLELVCSEIDCGLILQDTAALFAVAARNKGLSMHVAWQGQPGRHYWGDPIRLRQMLSNLLSNAVKFTEQGQIRVTGSVQGGDDRSTLIRISVADTGIGIPGEHQALLFQPFSQVDGSHTRRFSGTGLGLSIVRRLAEQMGGQAGVESRAGKGSTFWFEIRLAPVPTPLRLPSAGEPALLEAAPAEPDLCRDAPVLLVEDNPVNRKVTTALLNRQGLQVIAAENGQVALDYLFKGGRASLVLMDCQMPVMGGLEAAGAIRQWEARTGRAPLPIVALTASAFDEDRRRCYEVGMNDFLPKPLDFKLLLSMLEKYLPAAPAQPAGSAEPRPAP